MHILIVGFLSDLSEFAPLSQLLQQQESRFALTYLIY